MIGVLLAATIATPPFGTVTFAFRPCEGIAFRKSLPVDIGVYGVGPNGRETAFNSRYYAVWRKPHGSATFEVSLPTGAFRYDLTLETNGTVACSADGYTAAIAGHSRHEFPPMIPGIGDPLTASVAVGDLSSNGTASAIFTVTKLRCGDPIVSPRPLPTYDFTAEDGAYYLVLPGLWEQVTDVFGIVRLEHGGRTYYIRIPMARPTPTPLDINGVPAFVRYDLNERRLQTLFASAPNTLICME